jgi:hypothetical protein
MGLVAEVGVVGRQVVEVVMVEQVSL